MTSDEKLQVKKNTWWDIRESEQTIACLERQIDVSIQTMNNIANTWRLERLGAVSGSLVDRHANRTPQNIKEIP